MLEAQMADYVLEIVEGPEAGRQIPLAGPVVLGRDSSAGVALQQDELLSRQHVRLTPEGDGVRVEDLDSRNGTFVDGDQIFSPAHLAPGGQLLLGVTVLQLELAPEVARGQTSVRQIPASLTTMRPLPAESSLALKGERRVPTLATPEAEPDFLPASLLASSKSSGPGMSDLLPLLDVHTKGKARGAPIGIFVLCVLAVVLYLALR
jgi:pSer/pThr/pTyr-binding forkhead associated (FHA) protein